MEVPTTRWAKSDAVNVAYQILGSGPLDLVYVPGFCSDVELAWEWPPLARFYRALASFARLIVFDRRADPDILERVTAAGDEIIRACLDAGGVLSGEHGIGLEKRDFMPLLFGADDLDAQARLRDVFDPDGMSNPTKVLPAGSRCGDLQRVPEGAWI